MWVLDLYIEVEKRQAKRQVSDSIARITTYRSYVLNLISSLDYAAEGAQSNCSYQMKNDCQQVLNQMSQTIDRLHQCLVYLDSVELKRWVS